MPATNLAGPVARMARSYTAAKKHATASVARPRRPRKKNRALRPVSSCSS
jgi:hypothetical protein